jgi:hypothetical protein
MAQRFFEVLDCLDTAFIDPGLLDQLSQPGRLGAVRVGGIDLNAPRSRAVMRAAPAVSLDSAGFTSSDLAAKVRGDLPPDASYSASKAAYDLRKLRAKGLVAKLPRSRRYHVEPSGLRAMAALLLLRDKIVRPLLAAASRNEPAPEPATVSPLDLRYRAVHREMRNLFTTLGMAA